jgi:HNH endonuclease
MPEGNSTTSPVRYREIEGFPGYRVGDDGSVWSCVMPGGRGPRFLGDEWHPLRPIGDRRGYLHVFVRPGPGRRMESGRRRDQRRRVHRLILEAFVGPRPPGMECRHLDGDHGNNRLSNICWGTPADNTADKIRHGRVLRGEANPRARFTEDDIRDIRRRRANGESTRSIAALHGALSGTISLIARKLSWAHVQ